MPCPCCGFSERNLKSVIAVARGKLTAYEVKVFDMLSRSFGEWFDSEAVVSKVYEDDPNGGPDAADRVVTSLVWRMNTKLEQFGLHVQSRQGRGNQGRRLVWST